MNHKETKGKVLKDIMGLANELMGNKLKGKKRPVAMEIEISTATPMGDEDEKESRKQKLRELLKGG